MEPQSAQSEVEVATAAPAQRELVNDEDLLSPYAQETITRLASGLGVLLVVALFVSNLRRLGGGPLGPKASKPAVSSKAAGLQSSIAASAYGQGGQGT